MTHLATARRPKPERMNNNSNPEAQEAVLKIRTDGQNRRFILVADELMTIGRGSSCAIQIQDQSV
ncbi:hypothetical protein N8467_01120, partial [bacterium]|nr:hypothetical protein [bacterium]